MRVYMVIVTSIVSKTNERAVKSIQGWSVIGRLWWKWLVEKVCFESGLKERRADRRWQWWRWWKRWSGMTKEVRLWGRDWEMWMRLTEWFRKLVEEVKCGISKGAVSDIYSYTRWFSSLLCHPAGTQSDLAIAPRTDTRPVRLLWNAMCSTIVHIYSYWWSLLLLSASSAAECSTSAYEKSIQLLNKLLCLQHIGGPWSGMTGSKSISSTW